MTYLSRNFLLLHHLTRFIRHCEGAPGFARSNPLFGEEIALTDEYCLAMTDVGDLQQLLSLDTRRVNDRVVIELTINDISSTSNKCQVGEAVK